jgi:hypothetical protein
VPPDPVVAELAVEPDEPLASCEELENCTFAWVLAGVLSEVRSTPTAAAAVAKPITPTAEAAASLNGTSFLRMGIILGLDGLAGASAEMAAETIDASRASSEGRAGP